MGAPGNAVVVVVTGASVVVVASDFFFDVGDVVELVVVGAASTGLR